jgi:acyl dehydratase
MPIDYEKLIRFRIPDVENTWTERDTMLYGLAVGMAADPLDPRELAYVLEPDGRPDAPPLRVLPTMSTVLVWNDAWMYETGIDMTRQLHGEQRIRVPRPLPPAASVVGRTRITDVFDKGPGKGAVMLFETEIRDTATGAVLATNIATSYAQGQGGFGGPSGSGPPPHPMPSRPPDTTFEQRTLPTQALFYRLCGDRNMLHADPAYARRGGLPRPILHGLCTLGHAGAAVVRQACDYDAARIEELAVRFTRPVLPGDTLRTDIWIDGPLVSFRTRVVERDEVVLDHGLVRLRH